MHEGISAYGLWPLAIINSAILIVFSFSFTRPGTARDRRAFGVFSAFILALFAEMYGFPLTSYFLPRSLATRFPSLTAFSHDPGHFWHSVFGFRGEAHFDPFHIAGDVLVVLGFLLLAASWKLLHQAQQRRRFASSGPYARVRHPQYIALTAVMLGFLLQWPTLATLLMFPALIAMYWSLARREERDAVTEFGEGYTRYAAVTPAFFPRTLSAKADKHGAMSGKARG